MDNKDDSAFPFIDVIANALVMSIAIIAVLISFINIDTNAGKVDIDAKAIIVMTWDDKSKNDIDIWVRDPLQRYLYYQRKDIPGMNLDRDDQGDYKDTVVINGQRKRINLNQEVVKFRYLIDGLYIVNIHFFVTAKARPPEAVTITLYSTDPFRKVITVRKTLIFKNEERTMLLFEVRDGKIVDIITDREVLFRPYLQGGVRRP